MRYDIKITENNIYTVGNIEANSEQEAIDIAKDKVFTQDYGEDYLDISTDTAEVMFAG